MRTLLKPAGTRPVYSADARRLQLVGATIRYFWLGYGLTNAIANQNRDFVTEHRLLCRLRTARSWSGKFERRARDVVPSDGQYMQQLQRRSTNQACLSCS